MVNVQCMHSAFDYPHSPIMRFLSLFVLAAVLALTVDAAHLRSHPRRLARPPSSRHMHAKRAPALEFTFGRGWQIDFRQLHRMVQLFIKKVKEKQQDQTPPHNQPTHPSATQSPTTSNQPTVNPTETSTEPPTETDQSSTSRSSTATTSKSSAALPQPTNDGRCPEGFAWTEITDDMVRDTSGDNSRLSISADESQRGELEVCMGCA